MNKGLDSEQFQNRNINSTFDEPSIGIYQDNNDEINLKEVWQGVFRKKKWLFATAGAVFASVVLYTAHARIFKPIYQGSFSLMISDPMNPSGKGKNNSDNYSTSIFENIAINANTYEIGTLITLLKSPLFLAPIAEKFDLSTQELNRNITINQVKTRSNKKLAEGVLEVTLLINNKNKGKLLLDKLSETYLKASINRRQKKLKDGLDFLNKQAPEIYKKRNMLQTELVAFREKNKLIAPTIEGGELKDQQIEIEKNILKFRSEENRLKDIQKEIKNGTLTARGFQQGISSGLSVTDFDQSLLQQLISVERELAEAKSKFTTDSRVVKGLQLRLKQIQPILLKDQLEAVDTAINLNQGRLINANKQKLEIQDRFLEQPVLIKKYQNIKQEIEIANQNLLSLVKARESFQLEMAQNNIPWTIIKQPEMINKPIKPSLSKNFSRGLMLGLFLGCIAALIRDRFDHVFHYPEDAQNTLDLPLLGHIPHVDIFKEARESKESIIKYLSNDMDLNGKSLTKSDSYQRFFYVEAFRNLYTSIRFLNSDTKVKSVVLTSSLPKEGKSLINLLLAKTLSDMGEKILLIDADLRKPQIHVRLGLNNILGLSNLISDSNMQINEVVRPVKGFKNWDVITGGTKPPDPTRLLNSKRFENLLGELEGSNKYDIILLDAPPVLGLADSLLISGKVDGAILLVGLDFVDRGMPKEVISRIKSSGTTLFGIVTNNTTPSSAIKPGKYGYSEYGKYGYGSYGSSIYESYTNIGEEKDNGLKVNSIPKEDADLTEDMNSYLKNKAKIVLNEIKKINKVFFNWLDN